MEITNIRKSSSSYDVYKNIYNCFKTEDYDFAIKEIRKYINTCDDYNDLAFAYLVFGFVNTKLRDFYSSVDNFSKAISFEDKLDLLKGRSKDISLNARSNSRYKCDDFKGSIDDKRKAKKIRLLEEVKYSYSSSKILDYKKILLGSSYKNETDYRYKALLIISKIDKPKYDLIEDYKKFIDEERKNEVINELEIISENKYIKGDYKGSIKAIRRSEKYYF